MKRLPMIVAAILLIAFAALGVSNITTTKNTIELKEVQLQDTNAELKRLQLKYDVLNTQLEHTDKTNKAEIERLDNEKKQLEDEKKRLESELQAKAEEKRIASQAVQKAAQSVASTHKVYAAEITIQGCGDNQYANYIYMHESGCRTTAVNSIGCRGIGQACPGDKMPCGADYACQNAYFTNYAIQRYGSWEQAYYYWLEHSWW